MEVPSTESTPVTEESPYNCDDAAGLIEMKPEIIYYRCKKCRRIVASNDLVVPHEPGDGQKCFKWKKRNKDTKDDNEGNLQRQECSSIFVEPMKWMQETLEDGCIEDKIQCMSCKTRLGSFNWSGMQCSCGKWINPAFQLHKNRIDECRQL